MKKKKKSHKEKFVDEVTRFSSHDDIKIGDLIIYKRVSDDKVSVGEVKWFAMSSEGMSVTVIDRNLGNFQLGLCSLIDKNASTQKIKSLLLPKQIVKQKK